MIQIFSDLHLEYNWYEGQIDDNTKVVVLAGDISNDHNHVSEWVERYCSHIPVVYVAGNHEFHNDTPYKEHYEILQNELPSNVTFLQNSTTVINDIRFIGGTLWTDFEADSIMPAQSNMNYATKVMIDYRKIHDGKKLITPATILNEHQMTLNYFKSELSKPFDGKTVVISHHGPSTNSIDSRFKNSGTNQYYVSDLDYLFNDYEIDYWIHGHIHSNMDYRLGDARIIVNPRGYFFKNKPENPNFVDKLLIKA